MSTPFTQRGAIPLPVRSGVPGIAWPALPGVAATQLLAQLYQLDASQWLPRSELETLQFEQLAQLTAFAAEQSDHYRRVFHDAGVRPGERWDWATLRRVPFLTRGALLESGASIYAREALKAHGSVATTETSGSTGQTVYIRRTGIAELKWLSLVMREHLWHRRDFTKSFASIRANATELDDEPTARANGWGPPVTLLYATGPAYTQPLRLDVREQARWLLRRDPGYLLTFPTNLNALIDEFDRIGERPRNLVEARTFGETVSDDLRERCKERLGVPLTDAYSSQEAGPIAAMCPESGLYHVHAESLIVEVLDDTGQPCKPGEVGRVVITDLHNFATPLIRYEIRDYAEVGPDCPCGRGLPTLRRIVGRERNMMRLPSGERFWAFFGSRKFREVADVRQFQIIQHTRERLEARLVVPSGALTAIEEERLRSVIREASGFAFEVNFTLFPETLPRTPGGKFEEFLCAIDSV